MEKQNGEKEKSGTDATCGSESAMQRLVSEPSWQDVKNNNPIVAAVLRAGGDTTDCVIALARHNAELMLRIMEMENIAPRKIKVGDQVHIWRCPDHMVPVR